MDEVKIVKIEATRLKGTNLIRQVFVQLSDKSRKEFLEFTETEALDHFISD